MATVQGDYVPLYDIPSVETLATDSGIPSMTSDKQQSHKNFILSALDFLKHIVTTEPEDPASPCSSVRLNCFDFPRYLFFIAGSVIVPYFLYLLVAEKLGWTQRDQKTRPQHFATIVMSVMYMTLLWFLGNYSHTFDWMMAIVIPASMLAYGAISELPFAQQSLVSIGQWDAKMWALVITAVVIIALLLGYHIYLAVKEGGKFWIVYLISLLIPVTLVLSAYKINQNENVLLGSSATSIFHLHHWEIFFALAYFARFPNLISRIAAAIAVGCGIQDIAAYEYDPTFTMRYY